MTPQKKSRNDRLMEATLRLQLEMGKDDSESEQSPTVKLTPRSRARGRGMAGMFDESEEEDDDDSFLDKSLTTIIAQDYDSPVSSGSRKFAKRSEDITKNLPAKLPREVIEIGDEESSVSSGQLNTSDLLRNSLNSSGIDYSTSRASRIVVDANTSSETLPLNQAGMKDYPAWLDELEFSTQLSTPSQRKRTQRPSPGSDTETHSPERKKSRYEEEEEEEEQLAQGSDLSNASIIMPGSDESSELSSIEIFTRDNLITGPVRKVPTPVSEESWQERSKEYRDLQFNLNYRETSGNTLSEEDSFDLLRAINNSKDSFDGVLAEAEIAQAILTPLEKRRVPASTIERFIDEEEDEVVAANRKAIKSLLEQGSQSEQSFELSSDDEGQKDESGQSSPSSSSSSESEDEMQEEKKDEEGEILEVGSEELDIDSVLKKLSQGSQESEKEAEEEQEQEDEESGKSGEEEYSSSEDELDVTNMDAEQIKRMRNKEDDEEKGLIENTLRGLSRKMKFALKDWNDETVIDDYFSNRLNFIEQYAWNPTKQQKEAFAEIYHEAREHGKLDSTLDSVLERPYRNLIDLLQEDLAEVIFETVISSYIKLSKRMTEEFTICLAEERKNFIKETIPEIVRKHFSNTEFVLNAIIAERSMRWFSVDSRDLTIGGKSIANKPSVTKIATDFNKKRWRVALMELPASEFSFGTLVSDALITANSKFKKTNQNGEQEYIPPMIISLKDDSERENQVFISKRRVVKYMQSPDFVNQLKSYSSLILSNYVPEGTVDSPARILPPRRARNKTPIWQKTGQLVNVSDLEILDINELDVEEERRIGGFGTVVLEEESSDEGEQSDDEEYEESEEEKPSEGEEDIDTMMEKAKEKEEKKKTVKRRKRKENRRPAEEDESTYAEYIDAYIRKYEDSDYLEDKELPNEKQDAEDVPGGDFRKWLEYHYKLDSDFNSILKEETFVRGWFQWMIHSDPSRLLYRIAASGIDLNDIHLCLKQAAVGNFSVEQAVVQTLREKAISEGIRVSTYNLKTIWNDLVESKLHTFPQLVMMIIHQVVLDARLLPKKYFKTRYGFSSQADNVKLQLANYINQLNIHVESKKDKEIERLQKEKKIAVSELSEETLKKIPNYDYILFNDEWLTDHLDVFYGKLKAHWSGGDTKRSANLIAKSPSYACLAQQEVYAMTLNLFRKRLLKEWESGQQVDHRMPITLPRLHAYLSTYKGAGTNPLNLHMTAEKKQKIDEFLNRNDLDGGIGRSLFKTEADRKAWLESLTYIKTDNDLYKQWGIVTKSHEKSVIASVYRDYTIRYASEMLGTLLRTIIKRPEYEKSIKYIFTNVESQVLQQYPSIPEYFVQNNIYWRSLYKEAFGESKDPLSLIKNRAPIDSIIVFVTVHVMAWERLGKFLKEVGSEVTDRYNSYATDPEKMEAFKQYLNRVRTGRTLGEEDSELPKTLVAQYIEGVRAKVDSFQVSAMAKVNQGPASDRERMYSIICSEFVMDIDEDWLASNGVVTKRDEELVDEETGEVRTETVSVLHPYMTSDMKVFDFMIKTNARSIGSENYREDFRMVLRRVKKRTKFTVDLSRRVETLQMNLLKLQNDLGIHLRTLESVQAFCQMAFSLTEDIYIRLVFCLSRPDFISSMTDEEFRSICFSSTNILELQQAGREADLRRLQEQQEKQGGCLFLEPDVDTLEEHVNRVNSSISISKTYVFSQLQQYYAKIRLNASQMAIESERILDELTKKDRLYSFFMKEPVNATANPVAAVATVMELMDVNRLRGKPIIGVYDLEQLERSKTASPIPRVYKASKIVYPEDYASSKGKEPMEQEEQEEEMNTGAKAKSAAVVVLETPKPTVIPRHSSNWADKLRSTSLFEPRENVFGDDK